MDRRLQVFLDEHLLGPTEAGYGEIQHKVMAKAQQLCAHTSTTQEPSTDEGGQIREQQGICRPVARLNAQKVLADPGIANVRSHERNLAEDLALTQGALPTDEQGLTRREHPSSGNSRLNDASCDGPDRKDISLVEEVNAMRRFTSNAVIPAASKDTVLRYEISNAPRPSVAQVGQRSAVERAARALTPEEVARLPEWMRDAIDEARPGTAARPLVAKLAVDGAPTIPWQLVLRTFVGRATNVQPSYLRPPRRFPHLVGVVPGGARRPGKPRVMVVIDTSGSMTREQLEQIAAELRAMGSSRDVVVVECDDEIQRTYPFAGTLEEVHGGGGTDLRPPLEPAVLATIRPDVVVYFTDGQGPAQANAPRMPVLWCLTPGAEPPAAWGRTVWMA